MSKAKEKVSIITLTNIKGKDGLPIEFLSTQEHLSFICPIDLADGMSVKDSTHDISDGFLPRKKTIKTGRAFSTLICKHCHESGL